MSAEDEPERFRFAEGVAVAYASVFTLRVDLGDIAPVGIVVKLLFLGLILRF